MLERDSACSGTVSDSWLQENPDRVSLAYLVKVRFLMTAGPARSVSEVVVVGFAASVWRDGGSDAWENVPTHGG